MNVLYSICNSHTDYISHMIQMNADFMLVQRSVICIESMMIYVWFDMKTNKQHWWPHWSTKSNDSHYLVWFVLVYVLLRTLLSTRYPWFKCPVRLKGTWYVLFGIDITVTIYQARYISCNFAATNHAVHQTSTLQVVVYISVPLIFTQRSLYRSLMASQCIVLALPRTETYLILKITSPLIGNSR